MGRKMLIRWSRTEVFEDTFDLDQYPDLASIEPGELYGEQDSLLSEFEGSGSSSFVETSDRSVIDATLSTS